MASHIRTRSRCFSGSHSLPSTLGARRIFGRPRASSPACSERWEMVTARRHSPSRENTFTFGLPPLVSSPREQRRFLRTARHSSAEARPLQTLFQSFLPPKTTVGIVPFSRWALSSASFVSREATRAFRPFTVRPSFSRTSEGAPLFTALASFVTVWPSLFLARPSLVCVSSMSLSSTSRWESRTAWALRRASSTYRELRPKSSWPSSFTVSREAPSTSRVKAHRSQAQKRRISVARGVSSPRDQRGERKAGNVSGKNSPVIVMTSFLSFRFDTAHQLLKSLAHFPASPGPVQSRGKRRHNGQQVLHQLRVGILRLLTGRNLDLNSTPPQVTFQGRIPKPRQPVRILDQQPAKFTPLSRTQHPVQPPPVLVQSRRHVAVFGHDLVTACRGIFPQPLQLTLQVPCIGLLFRRHPCIQGNACRGPTHLTAGQDALNIFEPVPPVPRRQPNRYEEPLPLPGPKPVRVNPQPFRRLANG